MPEINGASLPPLKKISAQEKTLMKQQVKSLRFKIRALKAVDKCLDALSLPGCLLVSCHTFYNLTQMYKLNIGERNITSINNEFLLEKMEDHIIPFIAIPSIAMGVLSTIMLYDVIAHEYLDKLTAKCTELTDILNSNFAINYEDLPPYEGDILELSNEYDGCPISLTDVSDIEQKVFYRGKVFEYHYLMLGFTSRPNARDHTGRPYDQNEFYRLDDIYIAGNT